jgi:DNA-binding SARP family transcriptional activator
MLEFRILGPLEVVGDAGPIRLGGVKQRATLAILLLSANRVVSIERLADDLYAGAAPVTAVTQVQRQISELRKLLGSPSLVETSSPGYVIRLTPEQFDLHQFERWTTEADQARARGDVRLAADLVREALDLWRGPPLADLANESFAQPSVARLRDMWLAAVELRIEAELALGRHTELIGELDLLVAEHPLHEGLRGKLMLALYRSGRQADALEVYRSTRAALVEEFGIEPSPALHLLERAILTHDVALDLVTVGERRASVAAERVRAVLVLPSDENRLDELLAVAKPLAMLPGRELIIARLLSDEGELAGAASTLNARRARLEAPARVAAFTTHEPADDAIRLATTYDVDLVLLDAPAALDADRFPDPLAAILERSSADVALVARPALDLARGTGVFVPFGGGEHDWAALELGAWLASALAAPLTLVGTEADPRQHKRDASRLLADASLAVQRVLGVETTPLLAEATEDALVAAVEPASVVVAGLSPRWRREGVGATRRALVHGARPPVVLVHRGPRPGGLAPQDTRTRFSWSIEAR